MERHLGPTLWLLRDDFLWMVDSMFDHFEILKRTKIHWNGQDWMEIATRCRCTFPENPFSSLLSNKKTFFSLRTSSLFDCSAFSALTFKLKSLRPNEPCSFYLRSQFFFQSVNSLSIPVSKLAQKGLERAKCVPNKKLFVQFRYKFLLMDLKHYNNGCRFSLSAHCTQSSS